MVGSALLPRLLDAGHEVRCLVRDPRRLGHPIASGSSSSLADLAGPRGAAPRGPRRRHRHPPRGRDPRPAAAEGGGGDRARDPPPAARRRGRRRPPLHLLQRARGDRLPAHPLLPREGAGRAARWPSRSSRRRSSPPRSSTTPATTGSPGCAASRCFRSCRSRAPGRSVYEPIWAGDDAACMVRRSSATGRARPLRARRSRPDQLRGDRAADRRVRGPRPALVHVPLPFVRAG